MTHPVSVRTNTGDGLRMAMRVGAGLSNMPEAWWVPTIEVPVEGYGTVAWMVNGERTRPHCIMVNQRGQRFTNEATNYNALGEAFHVVEVSSYQFVNHPAWMVFDHFYLTKYGLAGYRPNGHTPAWIVEAPSLAELGRALDLPEGSLEAAVARWNENSAKGEDLDFGRGTSVHDRWWGDPEFGDDVRTTLGPLDTPPFYAVRVHSGALGTKGGPRTDTDAARPRPRRPPHRGPLCGRQRHGLGHGHDLRRRGRNPGARHGLRLPRRPPRREPDLAVPGN